MQDPNLRLLQAAARLLEPVLDQLVFVVMPTDERILGFTNRWYAPAISSAWRIRIAGLDARIVTSVYYMATKLEAFRGRGANDYRASHDLEDVIALVDGRPELLDEVDQAPADVHAYIASEIGALLATRGFRDALPGFLLPDRSSQDRHPLLLDRLRALADAGTHDRR